MDRSRCDNVNLKLNFELGMILLLTLNLCQVGGLYFSRDNLKELSRSLGINRQLMPVRKLFQVQIILKYKSTSNND